MTDPQIPPAFSHKAKVLPEWVDYNGHMADFAYGIAFSQTVTAFMDEIGLSPAERAQFKTTLYTLDLRIGYLRECHEGDGLQIFLHLLDCDAKRMHLYLAMESETAQLLAWNTQVLLHVSQAETTPKSTPFPAQTQLQLRQFAAQAAKLKPHIPQIDRPLGLGR